MSLTENGLGVPAAVRGTTTPDEPTGGDRMAGIPDVHEDGFMPRNSAGRTCTRTRRCTSGAR